MNWGSEPSLPKENATKEGDFCIQVRQLVLPVSLSAHQDLAEPSLPHNSFRQVLPGTEATGERHWVAAPEILHSSWGVLREDELWGAANSWIVTKVLWDFRPMTVFTSLPLLPASFHSPRLYEVWHNPPSGSFLFSSVSFIGIFRGFSTLSLKDLFIPWATLRSKALCLWYLPIISKLNQNGCHLFRSALY